MRLSKLPQIATTEALAFSIDLVLLTTQPKNPATNDKVSQKMLIIVLAREKMKAAGNELQLSNQMHTVFAGSNVKYVRLTRDLLYGNIDNILRKALSQRPLGQTIGTILRAPGGYLCLRPYGCCTSGKITTDGNISKLRNSACVS